MDIARAKEVLRSLTDGRNPATGQQFPPDSTYQQADTVRALFLALETLDRGSTKPLPSERRRVAPARPKDGTAWSPEEEQQLRAAFTAHKLIPTNHCPLTGVRVRRAASGSPAGGPLR